MSELAPQRENLEEQLIDLDTAISKSVNSFEEINSIEEIEDLIEDISLRLKRTAIDSYFIGKHLTLAINYLEVHSPSKIPEFWSRTEAVTNVKKQSLTSYMNVFKKFTLKDAEILNSVGTSETSIKLLAAQSTPEMVREEALELASEGKEITVEIAKELSSCGKTDVENWDTPKRKRQSKTSDKHSNEVESNQNKSEPETHSKPKSEPKSNNDESIKFNQKLITSIKKDFIPKWENRWKKGSVRQDAIDLLLNELNQTLEDKMNTISIEIITNKLIDILNKGSWTEISEVTIPYELDDFNDDNDADIFEELTESLGLKNSNLICIFLEDNGDFLSVEEAALRIFENSSFS